MANGAIQFEERICEALNLDTEVADAMAEPIQIIEDRHGTRPYFIGVGAELVDSTLKAAPRLGDDSNVPYHMKHEPQQLTEITLLDFVESQFVPGHVATKRTAGRSHYQAILKHIVTPKEVDRIFGAEPGATKSKLKVNPEWPYMNGLQLRDARPDHVQELVSAALRFGYSTQTAKHIRNVVSAIFSYAIKEHYFSGRNPASLVPLPGMARREAYTLTLAQTIKVLQAMRYPEREMALFAVLTSMNMAEVCGLQWKHVNLTDNSLNREGELIPPRSIAIRKHWYRGELFDVTKGRNKTIAIPHLLFSILVRLSRRTKNAGWNDFVLASRSGKPVNQSNIVARRVKLIGNQLQMPWLSWQVFRRTHTTLIMEFGAQVQHQLAIALNSSPQQLAPFANSHKSER